MSDPAQRMRELREMQEKIWRERQQAQLRNEAAQYLEGRIARDPMAVPNHHSLAPILQELGDHDEALRRLQFAAKDLGPRDTVAAALAGTLLLYLGGTCLDGGPPAGGAAAPHGTVAAAKAAAPADRARRSPSRRRKAA